MNDADVWTGLEESTYDLSMNIHYIKVKYRLTPQVRRAFLSDAQCRMRYGTYNSNLFRCKLWYMLGSNFSTDKKLSICEAVAFLRKYGKEQLSRYERVYCATLYEYEDMGIYGHELLTDGSFGVGGVYALNRDKPTHVSYLHNTQCYKNIIKNTVLHPDSKLEQYNRTIFIIIDTIVTELYARHTPICENTLMMYFDFVLGHELQHKHMDDTCVSQCKYVAKHWKPIYNITMYDAEEHCCDRSAWIYAVKRYHKRLRANR